MTDGTLVGGMVGPLQQLSIPILTIEEQAESLAETYCVKVLACPQVVTELLKSEGKAWLISMEIPSQNLQELTLALTSRQQKAEKSIAALILLTTDEQSASEAAAARASFSPQVASAVPGSNAALALPMADDPPGHKEHCAAAPSRMNAQARK